MEEKFFIYRIYNSSIAASAVNNLNTITIDNDADFIIQAINGYIVTGTTDNKTKALIEIWTGSEKWMNGKCMFKDIVGTAENPFYLPTPKKVPANTTVTVSIDNLDASNAVILYLEFVGKKVR